MKAIIGFLAFIGAVLYAVNIFANLHSHGAGNVSIVDWHTATGYSLKTFGVEVIGLICIFIFACAAGAGGAIAVSWTRDSGGGYSTTYTSLPGDDRSAGNSLVSAVFLAVVYIIARFVLMIMGYTFLSALWVAVQNWL